MKRQNNNYYGMTLYDFMEKYAEKGIDYLIEDEDNLSVNTFDFDTIHKKNQHIIDLNNYARIEKVVETEEDCVIYMKHYIYFN